MAGTIFLLDLWCLCPLAYGKVSSVSEATPEVPSSYQRQVDPLRSCAQTKVVLLTAEQAKVHQNVPAWPPTAVLEIPAC